MLAKILWGVVKSLNATGNVDEGFDLAHENATVALRLQGLGELTQA